MRPELEVDTEALRRCAGGLGDTGAELRTALARRPALLVAAQGWATGGAIAALQAAADRQLAALGELTALAARQITAAAAEYEAADDRAVARLRRVR